MIEANKIREFVQDTNLRSELNFYLKIENLGGYNDAARNKYITATANTALSVHLVLN